MDFQILRQVEAYEALSKAVNKWSVTVYGLDRWWDPSFSPDPPFSLSDVLLAAPWIVNHPDQAQLLADGHCVVLFDSEDDARQFYSSLPTEDNPKGRLLFLAELISPVKGMVSEST